MTDKAFLSGLSVATLRAIYWELHRDQLESLAMPTAIRSKILDRTRVLQSEIAGILADRKSLPA